MAAPTLVSRVAYTSDSGGQSSSTTPKVAAAVNAAFGRASCGTSNCWLILGGDTYSPYATTTTMKNYDQYFSLANIDPSRSVMTPGNHDNGSGGSLPDAAAWLSYNAAKGTLTRTNGGWITTAAEAIPLTDQFIDIGGIRWFFINSGAINGANATPGWPVPHTGGTVAGNPRATFLTNNWKTGLANVMVTHHPRYSYYGNHHDNTTMQNLVAACAGHTPLMLSGHDHNMQIFQPRNGLTTIVAGLCATAPYTGAGPTGQTSKKGDLQFANISSGASGFLQLDVMSDGSIVGSMIDAANTNGNLMTNTASTGITGAATFTVQTGSVVIDTTPPSTATLAVSAPTQGTLKLTMTATDDVGVTGFNVDRSLTGTGGWTSVGTNVPSPFTDSGLNASTQYFYRAKAQDAALNVSLAFSTVANGATTAGADVTPPTPPTSFTATVIGQTQINLGWVAGTDVGSGVAGYEITRNGVPFTIGVVTTYQDINLLPGTVYAYSMKTIDGAGNKSTATSTLTRTTTGVSTITYEYSLDDAAFVSNGSSATVDLVGLSPGVHWMQIRRVDSVNGNSDISSYAWTTPAVAPNPPVITAATDSNGTTIANGGSTASPNLTFTFTSDPGSTVQVTLDGVAQGTVTSPFVASNVAVGNHTVVFTAVAGGVASGPRSFSWARTGSGGGPGTGVYQRNVTLPGGIPGQSVPEQIWVRATDTGGAATVAQRNVTLMLDSVSFPVSITIASPIDGDIFDTGIVPILANADDTVTSVQATLDGVSYVSLSVFGLPSGGIQQWSGSIAIPTDGSVVTIIVVGTDGVTSATDNVSVVFGTIVDPGGGDGPPPPMIHPHTVVTYRVVHVDHNGKDVGWFDLAAGSTGTLVLNDAGSISYALPVVHPLARRENCDPDLYDWRIERNGVPLMAGPLDSVSVDTSTRSINISGKTWEAYLAQRVMPYNPKLDMSTQVKTYKNRDVLDIVRLLVDYVIGTPNSIPLTFAPTRSGIVLPEQVFDPSSTNDMLSIVQSLAQQQPGFDFDIDANCQMNFYVPQKGSKAPLVLDLDANAMTMTYTDEGIRGNNIIATASTPTGASVPRNASDTFSQKSARIIDEVVDFGTVLSPSALNAAVATELSLAKQKQREFSVTVDPMGENYWELATVGDLIKVRANTYYEKIDDYFRCTELTFDISDAGKEILTYTFTPSTSGG